jgi:hypothetical protein
MGVSQDTTSSIVGNTNLWLANTSRKAVLNAWKTGWGLGVLLPSLARLCPNKAVLSMRVTAASFAAPLPGNCNHSAGGASSCWTCKAKQTANKQTNTYDHTTKHTHDHTTKHIRPHTYTYPHTTAHTRPHNTPAQHPTTQHDHNTRCWVGLLCGRMCAVVCVYVFGCGCLCLVVWS